MYTTLDITLNNGQRDDARETIYISIRKTANVYSYHVDWETNGSSFDYADTGDDKSVGWQRGEEAGSRVRVSDSQWWCDLIKGTIEEIITGQTAIDDAETYLAGEGSWLVDFDADDFGTDKWETRSN